MLNLKTYSSDPAFPSQDEKGQIDELGLSKREYFAALAFQGLLADSEVAGQASGIARTAVLFADALIAALNGETLPHLPSGEAVKKGASDDD